MKENKPNQNTPDSCTSFSEAAILKGFLSISMSAAQERSQVECTEWRFHIQSNSLGALAEYGTGTGTKLVLGYVLSTYETLPHSNLESGVAEG